MSVRVRFAQSSGVPVHIGCIHTAIFNWLFARHEGGKFLLRIEDIESEQTTAESMRSIFEALEWLKMDYDDEPIRRSNRTNTYLDAANHLVENGHAYRGEKGSSVQGKSTVFCMPKDGEIVCDAIRGELHKESRDLNDFVIVHANGTPATHFADAVDDIDMDISHVIRGDENIGDTYRHLAICKALGAELPVYAHLPMMVNHQGRPYSKRDGIASVDEFKDKGYLPDAMFNFLALLGWSPGDDRELMTREEMIQLFDIAQIKSTPVRMDITRFEWMNGEYLRTLPRTEFAAGFRNALQRSGLWNENVSDEYLGKVAALMQDRTKTYTESPYFAGFFFTEEFHYDDMAVRNRIMKEGVKELLAAIREQFAALDGLSAAKAEDSLRRVAGAQKVAASQLVHPLRVAVSGLLMGPDLFQMLEVLGKERVLARIDRTLQLV